MDFLKNFDNAFSEYIKLNNTTAPVAVQPAVSDSTTDETTVVVTAPEVQQPNFVDFVRNELRNKNVMVYQNKDTETVLIRYKGDKSKLDWNFKSMTELRSLVCDLETHETLMIAPVKSMLITDFKEKHSTMDGVIVEDFPSGPMINLYHHPRKGWQLATRSYVGADNNFRCSEKSFRQLFLECLKKNTGTTLEDFVGYLDTTNTFSFVIMHPEYFDVARYAEPCLVLVEVRDRMQNHDLVDVAQVGDYFNTNGWTIKTPVRHNLTSWEAVDEFIKKQPSQEQGLVFRHNKERAKIRNNDFLVARKLLGNHSRLIDIFAENYHNKTTKDFVQFYPEKANEFDHYSSLCQSLCSATHAFYIAHNTRPANQKIGFGEIPRPLQTAVWNVHKQYLSSGTSTETRLQVKPNVIEMYYRNITAIELANFLTYWEKYVKEQGATPIRPRRTN
jgi:hypothetical protein